MIFFQICVTLALYTTCFARNIPVRHSWPDYETLEQKRCVFIHGSGNLKEGPVTDSFEKYWGNIHEFTPQCSSWEFNHEDTVTNLFDDPILMQKICDFTVGSGNDSSITNTIVFSHSMGGLIFANALRDGLCKMGPGSSWYDASAPFRGTKGADFVDRLCENRSVFAKPIQWLAEKMHYCTDDKKPNNAYLSMKTDYPAIKGLADFAAKHVNGTMCGDSAVGLYSKYSIAFEALDAVVEYGEPNDGMVPVSSCILEDMDKYKKDYKSDYYIAEVNHADSTCRDGNGDFDKNERDPCSWFSYRL